MKPFNLLASAALLALLSACTAPHKTAYNGAGGGGGSLSGGESLQESQDRSGETNPGETTGPEGTTDTGESVGFGAISG